MFFLIAYAISWAAWSTLFAQHFSFLVGPGRWLYLTAVLAPHAAAVVSTAAEGGRGGLPAFYRRGPAASTVSVGNGGDLRATNHLSDA